MCQKENLLESVDEMLVVSSQFAEIEYFFVEETDFSYYVFGLYRKQLKYKQCITELYNYDITCNDKVDSGLENIGLRT